MSGFSNCMSILIILLLPAMSILHLVILTLPLAPVNVYTMHQVLSLCQYNIIKNCCNLKMFPHQLAAAEEVVDMRGGWADPDVFL